VQLAVVWILTVLPDSALPRTSGALSSAGEAGLVAVSAGLAGGVESST
jgi:hypothetical protein